MLPALILVPLTENLEASQGVMIARPVEADNIAAARILEDRLWPVEGFFPDCRESKIARTAGSVRNFGNNSLLLRSR